MIKTETIREAFGFKGHVVCGQPIGARPMTFFVDLDWDQVSRRRAHHIGPLLDRPVVNALWEIPEGLDYPRSALPTWILDRLAGANLIGSGDLVRRDLRPPLRVKAAVASGPILRRLLADLGSFSAVCRTAAVLTGSQPDGDDPALLDARLFGVGVGVRSPNGISVLSEAGHVEGELGPYQWHLAEVLYAEFERAS